MKTVCITQLDDGSFSVGLEPMESEGVEMPEGPEGSPAEMVADVQEGEPSQSYASIDEALDAARGMFDTSDGAPMMDGENDFVGGFKNVRGKNGGF